MKKIIPFSNTITLSKDVSEITSISLEHDIKKESNAISGTFYITGEYKINDVLFEKEPFKFELPFDVALGSDYDINTLVIDIDDFRYELTNKNKLKVNIDLYIDGEIIENEEPLFTEKEMRELERNMEPTKSNNLDEDIKEKSKEDNGTLKKIQEKLDLLDEMINSKKEEIEQLEDNTDKVDIDSSKPNIFSGFNEEEKYVTYHVYRVLETDTLDKIIEKYGTTKEELAKYNNIEDIKPGDKLVIPTINDK